MNNVQRMAIPSGTADAVLDALPHPVIMINADDKLKPVFSGKSQVSMFEMTKLVSRHLK